MPVASPEVFTRPPCKPGDAKPGQLTQQQVDRFFQEGFLVVPDFFGRGVLQPVIDSINKLVEELAQKLFNAGKIQDLYKDATFYKRLTLIEKEFPGAAVLLHKVGVMPKAFRELWSNEKLLNVVEQFIGPDIAGHPIWNLRTKTPYNTQATVPWHQDSAYMSDEINNVLLATAWIPLIDANKENGCIEVARFGHQSGVLATHTCCAGPTFYIDLDEQEMEKTLGVNFEKDIVLCEVPFGGVLFINNMIPHRSLPNFSDNVRWSIDLRWQRPDQPNGFFGLKENVLLRSSKDPNHVIDWEKFAVDRHKLEDKFTRENTKSENLKDAKVEDPEFDTTIVGPWMSRWEIVHHNRHTAAFMKTGNDIRTWQKP